MSPIDDELRALLHSRADVLAASPDPLGGIERRAGRMRRNRVAASVAGAALAVSAVALAVPALSPFNGGGTTQYATSPSPAVSPSGVAQPDPALDPQHPWAYRGDPALIAGNELVTLRAEWSALRPGTTLTPLFGHVYEPSGQTEVAFLSTGDQDRWGIATSSEGGWTFPFTAPLPGPSVAMMAQLPGDEVSRLLILAAPSTGDISYAADGTSYKTVPMVVPGVAFQALEGDTSQAMVRILDGNGDLNRAVFEGVVPPVTPPDTTHATALAERYAFEVGHPWAYRGAPRDGTGDIVSADRKQFVSEYGDEYPDTSTPLYVTHLSASTDVAVVLHSRLDSTAVSFTVHEGTTTHQVISTAMAGEPIVAAYVPLDDKHGLLIAVVSDQAGSVVLQTGDRAEVGGSRTAGVWDWTPKADPQARLAAFAKGDAEPYASRPAN
jgi:hypothetical protein